LLLQTSFLQLVLHSLYSLCSSCRFLLRLLLMLSMYTITKNEIALAIDVFSTTIIVVVFTSIYPIMRHKKAVQDWFEFASGALIGSGFTLLFFPFFAAFFILTVIFYMIAFGGRATRYYGLLFDFSIMIVLRFFIPLGFIFWLSYAFWLGLLFGCALLFRSRSSLFIWSLPLLLLIPNFFFSS